ncbi:hypothetical protein M9H77_04571 [Catharanthus roseus]|uniref:Uncharacterized protein n=1 Tax=Catharanthus roseus TaxID=4058 RepID=A0ACC0CEV7_CATRO|nr:hypothetical protein M9H77_04571 [Catharanthus roseus]
MGDFNGIFEEVERLRQSRVSFFEVRDFLNCCVDLGLADINYPGSRYTWSNGHIWLRLAGRCVINNGCLMECFLQLIFTRQGRNTQFMETKQFTLCQKLKTLNGPLKELNKRDYANAKKNFIASFTKREGSLTTSKEEIQEEFLSFYVGLLGTKQDSHGFHDAGWRKWRKAESLNILASLLVVCLSVTDYGPLLDQVAKTLLVWSSLKLSYAGKLEVIRSMVPRNEAF